MSDKKTPQEWGADFNVIRPHVVAFTAEMRRLLEHLLADSEIDAQLECRTKQVGSFVEKIQRKNEKYADPLREITDLCGLRIIGYYQEDVAKIGKLLEHEFKIDWEKTIRYRPDSEPERFGYRSDQYVVTLADHRRDLIEWRKYQEDVAEIQVRTIMQHAWAAVDHKIRYKARDLPMEVRRRLFRLSALLETADDQFSAVKRESEEVEAGYQQSIDAAEYGDLPLNVISLRSYLLLSETSLEWAKRAVNLGYAKSPIWEELEASPKQYLVEEDLSNLLHALAISGTDSLADVEQLFAEAGEWGEEVLQVILTKSEERGFQPFSIPSDILTFFVLCKAGKLAAVERFNYNVCVVAGIQEAIRAKKQSVHSIS